MIKSDWWDYEENEFIQMQFTGLHDKNGKEIYEGDVVIDHDTKIKHSVSWNEKKVGWWLDRTTDKNGSGSYSASCLLPENIGLYDKGWEIIGNIYENPELI